MTVLKSLSPAKKCKDGVGGEAGQGGEADTHTDAPGPEAAVVAVVVELELAADDGDQGEDAPGGNAVPASANQNGEFRALTNERCCTCPTSSGTTIHECHHPWSQREPFIKCQSSVEYIQ